MSQVDELQKAEEALAQLEETQRQDDQERREAELKAEPVKSTAELEREEKDIPWGEIIPLTNIRPDLPEIHSLAMSIRQRGLLYPVQVRSTEEGYQLMAGRRRLEAFKTLHPDNSTPIRAQVIEGISEVEAYELMFTENVQRENLKPLVAAKGLRLLLDKNPELNASELARSLGLTPNWVQRHLRLLELPDQVLEYLDKGDLSFTAADLLRKAQKKGEIDRQEVTELADKLASKETDLEGLKEELGIEPKEPKEPVTQEIGSADPSPAPGVSEGIDMGLEAAADALLNSLSKKVMVETDDELELDIEPKLLGAFALGLLWEKEASDEYLKARGIDRRSVYPEAAALSAEEQVEEIFTLARALLSERQLNPEELFEL